MTAIQGVEEEPTEPTDRPLATPYAILRDGFGDCAVLFNTDTSAVCPVSPTGAFIWRLMDGHRTMAQILDEVKGGFADVPDAAGEHVYDFVAVLERLGFVGYDAEPGPLDGSELRHSSSEPGESSTQTLQSIREQERDGREPSRPDGERIR